MAFLRTPIVLLLAQILLFLGLVNAVPTPESLDLHANLARDTASSFWVANIKRQGAVAFGQSSGYQVYRNVKDFGAKGSLLLLRPHYFANQQSRRRSNR
jgi:glucan 1,3-beta-glucosidase